MAGEFDVFDPFLEVAVCINHTVKVRVLAREIMHAIFSFLQDRISAYVGVLTSDRRTYYHAYLSFASTS